MVNIKKLYKYGYLEIEGDSENIWFTSDLHLYHKNIIKLCNRPFADVEEMSNTLVENWNSVVKEDDLVFNLGDFCWSECSIVWSKLIDKLNGRQILIKGNHDHPKTLQKLSDKYSLIEVWKPGSNFPIKNLNKLFMIRESLEVRHNGERFLLNHYPQAHYVGQYHSVRQIFGHTHEKSCAYSPNHYNVCVERNLYRPVSLEEVGMLLTMQCRDNETNYFLEDLLYKET